MSDPVKNVEIEDVLSSIRRLLADGEGQDEARPRPQSADAARQQPVAPARVRADRRGDAPLVLTPALRVAGRNEGNEAEDAAPTPFPLSRKAAAEPEDRAPAVSHDRTPAASRDDDFEFTDLAAAPAAPAAPAASNAALRSKLKDTIAELESAITHRPDEWEPDGSEAAPVMDWSSARAEDAPFLSRRHPPAASAAQPAPSEASPETPSVTPPETPKAGFDKGTADSHADDSPAEPQAQPVPATSSVPLLDEETLRELIRDVLREELRGPLGDKITSNLRKLVRREIFRALASGEFG